MISHTIAGYGGDGSTRTRVVWLLTIRMPAIMPALTWIGRMMMSDEAYTASEQAMIDMGRRLIDEYDLDHGNAECFIQDHDLYVSVEGPNNATIGVSVPIGSSETLLRREIADYLYDFDADDTFDELWSPGFGEDNRFTPSQFIGMLQEDERFFTQRSQWLLHPEWGLPPEYGSADDVICEIRWVDEDLREWLNQHEYPITADNMDSMRSMVSGTTLKDRSIEEGWRIIDSMIDEQQLDHTDPDEAERENTTDETVACDPADPVSLSAHEQFSPVVK